MLPMATNTLLPEVAFILFISVFHHRIILTQGGRGEGSKCNPNAMVLAMSACQESRHKLSVASQTNDTTKLCGALQRYSNCMAPRVEGCKGATRMAFDVITTKYASHYNCRIVPQHTTSTRFHDDSTLPHRGPTSFSTEKALPGFDDDINNNNNNNHHHFNSNDKISPAWIQRSDTIALTNTVTTPASIVSNAIGIQPTMSKTFKNTTKNNNNNNNKDNNNTVITMSDFSTVVRPTDSQDRDATSESSKNNTNVLNNNDKQKVDVMILDPTNTTSPSPPRPANVTIIIFDPSHNEGSTQFQTWTHFILTLFIASRFSVQ